MILSALSGTCDVCGLHRSRHNSRACSAKRQAQGPLIRPPKESPKPLRLEYYLSNRKLKQMGWI
jgi:hypothetical protein